VFGGRGGKKYRNQYIVLAIVVVYLRLPVVRVKEWEMRKIRMFNEVRCPSRCHVKKQKQTPGKLRKITALYLN